ncbi:MAG: hypothetical protein JWQ73_3936 [Variovorax sp.]|nr:hypothetical protein [Variovorax sp.]
MSLLDVFCRERNRFRILRACALRLPEQKLVLISVAVECRRACRSKRAVGVRGLSR